MLRRRVDHPGGPAHFPCLEHAQGAVEIEAVHGFVEPETRFQIDDNAAFVKAACRMRERMNLGRVKILGKPRIFKTSTDAAMLILSDNSGNYPVIRQFIDL